MRDGVRSDGDVAVVAVHSRLPRDTGRLRPRRSVSRPIKAPISAQILPRQDAASIISTVDLANNSQVEVHAN